MQPPFSPRNGKTVSIAASTSWGSTSIEAKGKTQIRVYNASSVVIYITLDGTEPTSADMPIAPGLTDLFSVQDSTSVAALAASGSGNTIFFTPGFGV